METVYVNHGIASVHGNEFIEVNQHLKKYPSLLKKVLNHEEEHAKTGRKMDIWIDIKNMFDLKKQIQLLIFTFRHPSALSEMLPLYKDHTGELSVNPLLCIFYMVLVTTIIWR